MWKESLIINPDADLDYFVGWLNINYPDNFSGITKGSEINLFFHSEPDQDDKDAIAVYYSSLTAEDLLNKELIQLNYQSYSEDGIALFESVRADLVISYQSGSIDEDDIYHIEHSLEQVITKLIRGDWMSAKNEMINQVTVSGALTQELYDSILNSIETYIADNYG